MPGKLQFYCFLSANKKFIFNLSLIILILGYILLSVENYSPEKSSISQILTHYFAPVFLFFGYCGLATSILLTRNVNNENKKAG
jgi:hypothetical protein